MDVRSVPTVLQDLSEITRKDHSHPATYILIHEQSDRLYVGSTDDLYSRINQHRTKLESSLHKNRNLQEAFDHDSNFSVTFLRTENKQQALGVEQQTLGAWADSGRLLNIATDVNAAFSGQQHSESTRALLRERTIVQFTSQEAREKHSLISKQLWEDPDYRAKQKESVSRTSPEERSRQASEMAKKAWDDPIVRQKLKAHRESRKIPVIVAGVEYPSVGDASAATGIPKPTLESRMTSTSGRFDDYFKLKKE